MDKIFEIIKNKAQDNIMSLKGFLFEFRDKYGAIGIITIVLVMIKYMVFYSLMSVKANLLVIWILSLLITYFLFSCFKNKYIPAIIYLILSVLMFADVTYCSFFNKYLSVAMLGSAGMLGDVTESIKEIMKPVNFFMLLDAVMIIITIGLRSTGGKKLLNAIKAKISKESSEESEEKNTDEHIQIEKSSESRQPRDILAELDAMAAEENQENNSQKECEDADIIFETANQGLSFQFGAAENISDSATVDETQSLNTQFENTETYYASPEVREILHHGRVGRKRREKKRKKEKLKQFGGYKNQIIPIAVITVLIITGSFSPFMQSLAKQEFYTYHIGDIVTEVFGLSGQKHVTQFTDSYAWEKEGPLFGIAKDKNLVVIQIESFQDFLIGMEYNGQEVTPFLNSLIQDKSVYFDNYYQQVGTGNTSDAEFTTNNSILGSIEAFTYQLYEKNYFRGLPVLLKEKGYETAVLHAHENRAFWNRDDIYPNLGFDHYYGGLIGDTARPGGNFNMTEWMGWGLTDTEFYPQAMEYIKELSEPFYSFVITLSNHHPYVMLDKYNFIELLPEDKDTLAGNYINSAAYTDYALKQFFEQFKEAGLYENTVFALYGDHMGLSAEEETNEVMERILGHEYEWDDRMNIPMIFHIPGADDSITQTLHNAGGQIDFLPTIAYLMGFESLDTIYLGHNLFTSTSNTVAEHAYLPYGSFFIDGYGFEMSRDGVFKNGRAWNLNTRQSVDVDELYDYYIKSMEISDTSIYILQNDILRKVYEEGISAEEVF